MTKRRDRNKRDKKLLDSAGDLRCPEHHTPYKWQPSEMWWRCPQPNCLHKITAEQITKEVLEAMECHPENFTSSELTLEVRPDGVGSQYRVQAS